MTLRHRVERVDHHLACRFGAGCLDPRCLQVGRSRRDPPVPSLRRASSRRKSSMPAARRHSPWRRPSPPRAPALPPNRRLELAMNSSGLRRHSSRACGPSRRRARVCSHGHSASSFQPCAAACSGAASPARTPLRRRSRGRRAVSMARSPRRPRCPHRPPRCSIRRGEPPCASCFGISPASAARSPPRFRGASIWATHSASVSLFGDRRLMGPARAPSSVQAARLMAEAQGPRPLPRGHTGRTLRRFERGAA